jgi:tetratricopeptide (TPR) repeat protein
MASDDQSNQSGSTKKQLLDEIRKRAEQAEMSRLDQEERNRPGSEMSARLRQSTKSPFPISAAASQVAPNKAATQQKILVLRERLLSAIERGKKEKAAELFLELSKADPDNPELSVLKKKLQVLEEQKPPAPEQSVLPQAPVRDAAAERADREVKRKHIADMMGAGDSYYQQEKYDKAAQYVSEVLKLDPTHGGAIALRDMVEKAKVLAEQILREEEEGRAKERAAGVSSAAPPEPAAPTSGRPTDFWGASLTGPAVISEYDLIPQEKGPVGPPPIPFSKRFSDRISSFEVPVKPLLTIAVVAVLAVAAWYIYDTIHNSLAPARYSLLILPATTPGDTSLAVIADGCAEDLMAGLAQVADMRVIAPITSFAFSASNAPAVQIARALGANDVLSWSMKRVGEKVLVQCALVDTASGGTQWSSNTQVSLRELPSLMLELMRGIAASMGTQLVVNDGKALRVATTNSEAAFGFYARGRAYLRTGDSFAPEEAIAALKEAIRLDPDFGDAYAALAWAHILAYETSIEMPPAHLAEASIALKKAMESGLRSSEVFRVNGLLEQYRGDYGKAIQKFEQAVNVSPSDAEAQRRLALAYAATGKLDLAVKAGQRSVADDPANITAQTLLGQIYQFRAVHMVDNRDDYRAALRAYEQGMRVARDKSEYSAGAYADVLVNLQQSERALDLMLDRVARVRESYVDLYKLGRVQQSAGRPSTEWRESFLRAREILTTHLGVQPDDAVAEAYLALVHTRLGAFKEAIAAIDRAQKLAPSDIEVLHLAARMYALQKDKAKALEFLHKALDRRFNISRILDLDYFNLYSEPDFVTVLTRPSNGG